MSAAPTWITLFLDVPRADVDDAARFWAAVTDSTVSPSRGENGQFVTLLPRSGSPLLKVQAVEQGCGVHLDVEAAGAGASDRDDLAHTALALGATNPTTYDDVIVLRSPGGLPFCVTPGATEPRRLVREGDAVLDQVCLDIPAAHWDAEVEFWRDVTGRDLTPAGLPEYASLVVDDPAGPVRILLQRTSDDGPVRAHPDLAVADRPTHEARHVAAGARLVRRFDWWTVLHAPGGQVYCLTDRDPATGRVQTSGTHS